MNVFLAHPSGNQFFRNLAAALYRADSLGGVATSINWNPRGRAWFDRLTPRQVRQELGRRSFREPWAAGMQTHPIREVARLVSQRFGWASWQAHEHGWCCVDAVYRDFDRAMAREVIRHPAKFDAVYAYEDAAEASFIAARAQGARCCYDLPIAYWETGRRLMSEEAERRPDWSGTLGGGINDSPAKLARKIHELELADLVVVPSSFVADSLPGWAKGKRVVMAPFGSPVAETREVAKAEKLKAEKLKGENCKLRVLFAGSMGQRKGLGDLFTAMRLLRRSDVEFVVMGSLLAPMAFYREQWPDFTYEPGRPHADVLALMRSCDVFCLPSIVEGRALVMQEAMSQGLPIIITPNTGGEDLIEEGKTGFLVPIRSPSAIAERLAWCADNRKDTCEMGREAQRKAAGYTWQDYGEKIVAAVKEITKLGQ